MPNTRSPGHACAFSLLLYAAAAVITGCHSPREEVPANVAAPGAWESIAEAHQASTVCTTIQRGVGGAFVSEALIRSGAPDKNYGGSGSLTCGAAAPGSTDVRQGLVYFDLATLPAGAVITSATAELTVVLHGGAPTRAHRVTSPWNEGAVTWNSFNGAYDPAVEATFPAGSPTTADLTALVQGWWSGSIPNDGLLLERDPTGLTVFGTSEGAQTARPSLTVCYTTCNPTPETCNGIDDDCDGQADEDPDLCPVPDACHVGGFCQAGACVNVPQPDGTACDDGNDATVNDVCMGGICAGIDNCSGVSCTAPDACHTDGTCDPYSGLCSYPNAFDGTSCEDGDLCTQGDTCQSGFCQSGMQVMCYPLDACHSAGTCDPSTGVCSDPPNGDPACTGALAIWEIAPPDVSVMRALGLAAAFGMPSNAPVEDTAEAVRIVATTVANPGFMGATPTNMAWSMGNFSYQPVSSPPPYASGSIAHSGFYSLPPSSSFYGRLSGGVFQGGSFKTLTGTVVTPMMPASGMLDLSNNTVTFSASLVLRWSCSGTGCFTGTCDVPVNISTPAQGSSYDPDTGLVRVSGSNVVPAISNCMGGTANPALVNALLGLPATLHFQTGIVFSQAPVPRVETLTLMRASGAISYTNPYALTHNAIAPTLPDDGTAESIATAFLNAQGLMPPDAEVEVVTEDGEDIHGNVIEVAKRVTFEPHLQVGVDSGGNPLMAHVHHAGVEVWLGAIPAIVSFQSSWRPVIGKYTDLPSRDMSAVRNDFAAGAIDLPGATAKLMYNAAESDVPQRYFDPVYMEVIQDDEGNEHEITGATATDFAPRLTNLSPLTDVVDGSSPVPLSVSATWGSPPYSFSWTSDRDGFLGTGSDITTELSNGRHIVRVDVSDARGFSMPIQMQVNVTGSSKDPVNDGDPGDTGGPGTPGTAGSSNGELTKPVKLKGLAHGNVDSSFTAARRDMPNQGSLPEDQRNTRAGPLISNGIVAGRGKIVFEEVYFEQLRYEVEVQKEGGGAKRRMRSDKCYDGNLPGSGGGACVRPTGFSYSGPWARGQENRPPIEIVDGSHLRSKWVIDGVPGQLTMLFQYSPFMAPRPPEPAILDWLAIHAGAMQPYFFRALGGNSPGYQPRILWYYKPPDGGVTACDVMTFCQQTTPNTNVDPDTGNLLPVCDSGMLEEAETACNDDYANATTTKYTVTDFELHLFTAIRPQAKNRDHYMSLVQDETPANRGKIMNSDGGIHRLFQPFPLQQAGVDLFTEILPMQSERTVQVAYRSWAPGEFDNVHSKAVRKDGFFPIPWWVFFIGGNSPLHRKDNVPVFHMHESWERAKPASVGQDVFYTFLVDTPANREPMEPPYTKAGPGKLHTLVQSSYEEFIPGQPPAPGVFIKRAPLEITADGMIWHHAKTSSKECRGPNVDNSVRHAKCPYFDGGFFFTH